MMFIGKDDERRSERRRERDLVGWEGKRALVWALKRFYQMSVLSRLNEVWELGLTGFLSSSPRMGVVSEFPANIKRDIRLPSISSCKSQLLNLFEELIADHRPPTFTRQPLDEQLRLQVRRCLLRTDR